MNVNSVPNQNPMVSIVVRTKNRPHLLLRAIGSIARQDYRPLEIVLVNDGGAEPDLEQLIRELGDVRLEYVRHEQSQGRARSANAGMQRASGRFIGFLDDDDEFIPEHVSLLAGVLKDSDFRVAYSDCRPVYSVYDPERKGFQHHLLDPMESLDPDPKLLLQENHIPFICLMVHREVLESVGYLDEDFELYEDWDFIIRLSKRYSFYHVKRVTCMYRQWDSRTQMAFIGGRQAEDAYLKVMRKYRPDFTPEILLRLYHEKKHVDNVLQDKKHREREQRREVETLTRTFNEKLALKDSELLRKDRLFEQERQKAAEEREKLAQELHAVIDLRNRTIQEFGRDKERLKGEIEGLMQTLDQHRLDMLQQRAEVNRFKAELDAIRSTMGWQVVRRFQSLMNRLFPPGSIRGWPYHNAKKVARTLATGGVTLLAKRVRSKVRGASARFKGAERYTFSVPDLLGSFHEPLPATLSVVIPTWNGGAAFEHVLEKILSQKGIRNLEVIVVDSGSTDDTMNIASDAGAVVLREAPGNFTHGGTRNLGAEPAKGDFILFMTQDAVPAGEYAVYQMVKTLMENPDVAAASCREVPRTDADLFACWQIANHHEVLELHTDTIVGVDKAQFKRMSPGERRRLSQLNNIFCCVRKEVFDRYKFRRIEYSEDLDLGLRFLEGGHKIAYLHSVGVIHSHNRPPSYFFKRSFVDTHWLSQLLGYDSVNWRQQGFESLADFYSRNVGLLEATCLLARELTDQSSFSPNSAAGRLREISLNGGPSKRAELGQWDSNLSSILEGLEPLIFRDADPFSSGNGVPYILDPFKDPLERYLAFATRVTSGEYRMSEIRQGLVKLAATFTGALLGAAAHFYREHPGRNAAPAEYFDRITSYLRADI